MSDIWLFKVVLEKENDLINNRAFDVNFKMKNQKGISVIILLWRWKGRKNAVQVHKKLSNTKKPSDLVC